MTRFQFYRTDQTVGGEQKIVLARGLTERQARRAAEYGNDHQTIVVTQLADYSASKFGYEEES